MAPLPGDQEGALLLPLTSFELESLHPVYMISCLDYVSEFNKKKSERKSPEYSLKEGNKLLDCVMKSQVKVKATPCSDIQQEYFDCLTQQRVGGPSRLACRPLASALEECTAKHIGKLDED